MNDGEAFFWGYVAIIIVLLFGLGITALAGWPAWEWGQ